jgi:TRAP-type C4-dicarboxylate transport system substrate-binding protein
MLHLQQCSFKQRALAVFLLACGISASPGTSAQSNAVDDWLSGSNTRGVPAITYTGPPIEAKFGHPVPPTSLVPPVLQRHIDRLAKLSNNKLLIKQQGGGTLIGARDGFKGVRGGLAEIALCYVQNEGRATPLSRVFEQPFVALSNPMAGVRVMQELAPKYFVPEFQKQGVVWGSAVAAIPADLLSKKPVRTWEDLSGMKVIAQGFPPELAKAMNVTIVNIPFPEAFVALQQGLADAMFWVDAGFIPYKIFEVARYHTTVGITGFTINTCYGKEFSDKLPADLRELFYNSQEPMAMAATKIAMIDFNKTAGATYREKGVEMITLSPAELQRWRDMSAPAVEKWASDLEKEGLPARALLADVKRLGDKYSRMSPDELMKLSIESPVKGIK